MKPTKKANEMSTRELAAYIDYSVLKPEFTEKEIIELTKDGVQLGCATICINPGYMNRYHALPCHRFSVWYKFYAVQSTAD